MPITTPEILAFLLCDGYDRKNGNIMRLRHDIGFPSLPSPPVNVGVFFEIRVPRGVVDILVSLRDPEGAELAVRTVPSETASEGGAARRGAVGLPVQFAVVGHHTARLKVGPVVMERQLCVWTPETRDGLVREAP